MATRKSILVVLVMFGWISAIVPGCGLRRHRAAKNGHSSDQIRPSREIAIKKQSRQSCGKLEVPADLFVDLVQPVRSGAPASILVSASTEVVAGSGAIMLRVPPIGVEPGRSEVLWAGAGRDFIAETQEYVVGPLPIGKHKFVAILAFTPDNGATEELVVSKSLYLDVRPDEILCSNVSFRQIARLELYRQLEQRVLKDLSPGLAAADGETMARYRELVEAASPGLIDSEIARLKATDADVARRIMQLNSTRAETAN